MREAVGRGLVRRARAHLRGERVEPQREHLRRVELTLRRRTQHIAAAYVRGYQEPVPIGRPIANTEIFILDEHLQPVPVGITGDLYIGGDGLARGYLNRPDLTAEKFIPHPFPREGAGTRVYKTGDLCRYRPDGTLQVCGRRDDQIKLRGYRIEPNEIVAALNQHSAVRDSVVVAREDAYGTKSLVAHVVPRQAHSIDADVLRNHLRQKLPDYMVPSKFVLEESLPLLPNGKLDRGALPAPHGSAAQRDERSMAPRTATEELQQAGRPSGGEWTAGTALQSQASGVSRLPSFMLSQTGGGLLRL